MPVNSMPGFWAISSFPMPTDGMEAAGLDFGCDECCGGMSVLARSANNSNEAGDHTYYIG